MKHVINYLIAVIFATFCIPSLVVGFMVGMVFKPMQKGYKHAIRFQQAIYKFVG